MLPRVFVCETFLCAQGKILQGTSITSVDFTLSLFAYKQNCKIGQRIPTVWERRRLHRASFPLHKKKEAKWHEVSLQRRLLGKQTHRY